MSWDFWRSRAVWVSLCGTALWSVYTYVVLAYAPALIHTAASIDAAMAFVLGILMALRINRAYERWWEARTLWGTLINASRNLAVKVDVFAALERREAKLLHTCISAFAFGLRDHLRGGASLAKLRGLENEADDPEHVPSWIVDKLYAGLNDLMRRERINGHHLRMLDLEARILLEVAGGCEKIRTTSLPPILTWVTRSAILGALVGAPWVLRDELGPQLIPIAGLGVFLVLVVEALSEVMEQPFGIELNQLDLTVMSGVIERSTGEILGIGEEFEDPGTDAAPHPAGSEATAASASPLPPASRG